MPPLFAHYLKKRKSQNLKVTYKIDDLIIGESVFLKMGKEHLAGSFINQWDIWELFHDQLYLISLDSMIDVEKITNTIVFEGEVLCLHEGWDFKDDSPCLFI